MDYRIEKRGAFQVVCKRKRVDKPQSGTAAREDLRYAAGIRRERHAGAADAPPPGAAVINFKIEASLRTSPQAGAAVPWILLECSDVLVRA